MPLLLWAGMRTMGERGNAVLVLVGGLVWAGLSGYYIDDIDFPGGTYRSWPSPHTSFSGQGWPGSVPADATETHAVSVL
jgi:hypothetical protein